MTHERAKIILNGAMLYGDYIEYGHIASMKNWAEWRNHNSPHDRAAAESVYRNLKRMELP